MIHALLLPSPDNMICPASPVFSGGFERTKESTLKLLHLTDVHLDLEYEAGTQSKCDFALCCRKPASAGEAGDWGSLEGNCDCLFSLAQSSLQAVRHTITRDPPAFILWTGDVVPHDVWATSRQEIATTASRWMALMHEHLNDTGIPVLPVLGNHEALPVNM